MPTSIQSPQKILSMLLECGVPQQLNILCMHEMRILDGGHEQMLHAFC